jgi:hypothetical protein
MTVNPAGGAPEVKIGDWLRDGWAIFVSDVGMFLLASLIYNVIIGTCLGGLILYGPLTCGMYLMIFDRMQGGKVDVRRLFKGFDFFGQAFVAGLIFFALASLGMAIAYAGLSFFVIPSLIGIGLSALFQTAFLFTFQLIVDRKGSGIGAISTSYVKITENFGQFLLFGLVSCLIQMVGYATFFVGCLVTTPLVLAASAAAYRDVFGLEGAQTEQQQTQS